jgi:hypothetical protein
MARLQADCDHFVMTENFVSHLHDAFSGNSLPHNVLSLFGASRQNRPPLRDDLLARDPGRGRRHDVSLEILLRQRLHGAKDAQPWFGVPANREGKGYDPFTAAEVKAV